MYKKITKIDAEKVMIVEQVDNAVFDKNFVHLTKMGCFSLDYVLKYLEAEGELPIQENIVIKNLSSVVFTEVINILNNMTMEDLKSLYCNIYGNDSLKVTVAKSMILKTYSSKEK